MLSDDSRTTHPLLYTGDTLEENKELNVDILEYVNIPKEILRDTSLNDSEKMLYALIKFFNEKGKCLYATNSTIAKCFAWDVKKVQRTITSLYNKKKIIIGRKSLNSPIRQIYIYKRSYIAAWQNGSLSGTHFVFDYKK